MEKEKISKMLKKQKKEIREYLLKVLKSEPDSPNIHWNSKNFMSFLEYVKNEVKNI